MISNHGPSVMDFKHATQSQAFCDGFQGHWGSFRKWKSPLWLRSQDVWRDHGELQQSAPHSISHFENIFWATHLKFRARPKRNLSKVSISKTQQGSAYPWKSLWLLKFYYNGLSLLSQSEKKYNIQVILQCVSLISLQRSYECFGA